MQAVQYEANPALPAMMLAVQNPAVTPAAMALYLRRTSGEAAFCFARVMWEDSAWANADWGDYWASVMRLV